MNPFLKSLLLCGTVLSTTLCAAAPKTYNVASPDGRMYLAIEPTDSLRFSLKTPAGENIKVPRP